MKIYLSETFFILPLIAIDTRRDKKKFMIGWFKFVLYYKFERKRK